MKSARLRTDRGGEWWILVHDLGAVACPPAGLRPINYLTFFAQWLAGTKKQAAYRYAMALEDKLAYARIFHGELRAAVARAGQVGAPVGYLRGYEDEQRIGCMLEALLNAIYSSLELAAKLNCCFHGGLKWSFRDQARKWPAFGFDAWPWLPRFFDVRSQLAHFGSSLQVVPEGKIVLDFTLPSLEVFSQGLQEVHLNEVGDYAFQLFELLDEWAIDELRRVEPEREFDIVAEPTPGGPLHTGKRRAADILAGMNSHVGERRMAEKVRHYIVSLKDFRLIPPAELYTHMGALLVDTVLQAGISYKAVVLPRVKEVLARPEASTTSGFLGLLRTEKAETVLRWQGRKVATLLAVVTLLKAEGVERVEALREWLRVPENRAKLRGVRGIADKTMDYVQVLSGLQSVAVDVHLKRFLVLAGVQVSSYEEARRLLVEVARLLGIDAAHLDQSIWRYMSEGEGRRRQAGGRGRKAAGAT